MAKNSDLAIKKIFVLATPQTILQHRVRTTAREKLSDQKFAGTQEEVPLERSSKFSASWRCLKCATMICRTKKLQDTAYKF